MKKKLPTLSSWAGTARWIATLTLLAMLAIASTHLAQSLAAASGARTTPDFAAIDKFVEVEMQAQRIPGLALGIVQGNQIVHLKGFGIADPSGRVVTPQTPFILGSTTKSFTALAVMQLVEAGKIELDAPAQRYIPWFRVADEAASAQITVRHLLNQTSGFSTAAGRKESIDFDSSTQALENRVRRLRDVELTEPVGATYQYSNCNYQALGLIVQIVSGQEFESYVQQHILSPLDMRNSFTSKEEAQQHGLALGHRSVFGLPLAFDEPFPRGSVPSGFIISSAEDMSHYLIAHLDEGRYGGAALLSPAGIVELHHPAARQGDSETFYGMGWEVGPINGLPAIWHDGDTFSFHSFMILVPETGWGVVVLSNVSNIPATARFQTIAPGIVNLLVGRQPTIEHVYDSLIVHSVVVGIVVLQIIGMTWSVVLLRRWRDQPQRRPSGWLGKGWHIALPLVLNLLWALFILVGLPRIFAPLPALTLGIPDLGYMLVASGLAALGWGILRTALAYFALRETGGVHPVEFVP
jgi:CubicO group peptidase (beta-lactamase class C family)